MIDAMEVSSCYESFTTDNMIKMPFLTKYVLIIIKSYKGGHVSCCA